MDRRSPRESPLIPHSQSTILPLKPTSRLPRRLLANRQTFLILLERWRRMDETMERSNHPRKARFGTTPSLPSLSRLRSHHHRPSPSKDRRTSLVTPSPRQSTQLLRHSPPSTTPLATNPASTPPTRRLLVSRINRTSPSEQRVEIIEEHRQPLPTSRPDQPAIASPPSLPACPIPHEAARNDAQQPAKLDSKIPPPLPIPTRPLENLPSVLDWSRMREGITMVDCRN